MPHPGSSRDCGVLCCRSLALSSLPTCLLHTVAQQEPCSVSAGASSSHGLHSHRQAGRVFKLQVRSVVSCRVLSVTLHLEVGLLVPVALLLWPSAPDPCHHAASDRTRPRQGAPGPSPAEPGWGGGSRQPPTTHPHKVLSAGRICSIRGPRRPASCHAARPPHTPGGSPGQGPPRGRLLSTQLQVPVVLQVRPQLPLTPTRPVPVPVTLHQSVFTSSSRGQDASDRNSRRWCPSILGAATVCQAWHRDPRLDSCSP